ncbi:MAG: heavy metal-binding domain-containing protein [Sulfuricaulis sp.]
MNRKKMIIGLIVLAALGAAGVAAWRFTKPGAPSAAPETAAAGGCKKVLYWTDPMIPGFKSDKPGKSPMNMDMIPVCADDQTTAATAGGAPVVTIRPEIIQNLGVRTYKVTHDTDPRRSVVTTGYLQRDARGYFVAVDVFDRDVNFVRAGLPAEVDLPDAPGPRYRGTVENVTRERGIGAPVARARVRLLESGESLQTDLLAEATIQGTPPGGAALYIPREALIRTGRRTAVVLALGQGRFQPVDVIPGVETGDWVEIRRGIKEGDTVVTSGQFLIDSEASIRASFARMEPASPNGSGDSEGRQP